MVRATTAHKITIALDLLNHSVNLLIKQWLILIDELRVGFFVTTTGFEPVISVLVQFFKEGQDLTGTIACAISPCGNLFYCQNQKVKERLQILCKYTKSFWNSFKKSNLFFMYGRIIKDLQSLINTFELIKKYSFKW